MRPVLAISAGFAHAVLMMLAYPPVGFWPAALIAMLPLVWAAVRISSILSACPEAHGAGDAPQPPVSRRRSLAKSLRPALLLAVGVLPFYIYQLHWLIPVTAVGYVPMAIGMALFASAFVWLTAEMQLRLPRLPLTLTVPIIWTGLEVFRGEVAFSGYPWFLLAHPLIDAPILPLPATVLGTYFVSFLLAMLAGAVADLLLLPAPRKRAALAGFGAAAVALVGARLAPGGREATDAPLLRIAVVQTNLPQDNKISWTIEQKILDFERFLELTRQAATADPAPDLIVWPETMFPDRLDPQAIQELRSIQGGFAYAVNRSIRPAGFLLATDFHDWLIDLHAYTGVPMLVGAVGVDNLEISLDAQGRLDRYHADAFYNSVFLLSGGEVNPRRYDKLRLTPFGEFMPYINQWPWLERQLLALGAHGMSFDLSAGQEPRTFQVKNASGQSIDVATPICFEVTAPRLNHLLLRTAQQGNPRILINVTNDGWFSTFNGGRQQHLQISRWRSLESGVPMVRAANTGISAWIDSRGRIVQAGTDQGALAHEDGILTAEVRVAAGRTLYSRTGDTFAWVVLAAAGGLVLVCFIRPRVRS